MNNQLKASLRNFKNKKRSTMLNILALSVGISSFLILTFHTQFEESFDSFHDSSNNIYKVILERYGKGNELLTKWDLVPPGLGNTIVDEFPEVIDMTRYKKSKDNVVKSENRLFEEPSIHFVDPSFFDIFSFEFIQGDKKLALSAPYSIILTESMSKKYFGDESPLNKQLEIANRIGIHDYLITGVIKDSPRNSSLKFQFLSSFSSYYQEKKWIENSWGFMDFPTFIRLDNGSDQKKLESLLPSYVEKHRKNDKGISWELLLQPLSELHLNSDFSIKKQAGNSKARVINMLKIVAIMIILISWINYINLSIAQSTQKSKQIILLKCFGASRMQIIKGLILETLVVNTVAGLASLAIIFSSINMLSTTLAFNFGLDIFISEEFWILFLLLIFIGGTISGIYPAFALSSYRPSEAPKTKQTTSGSPMLREGLIGMQFLVSLILISSTIIIISQNRFMKNTDLGFDLDDVVVFKKPNRIADEGFSSKIEPFKHELEELTKVSSVSVSHSIPSVWMWSLNSTRSDNSSLESNIFLIGADESYHSTYGLSLVIGRWLSKDIESDKNAIVVNEELLKELLIEPRKAIGTKLKIQAYKGMYEIIGVVKNHHHFSPQTEILPVVFMQSGTGLTKVPRYFSLKLNDNQNINESISQVEKLFLEFFPGDPFRFFVLSSEYQKQYEDENKNQNFFSFFSIIAIILASIGSLSLLAFMVTNRLFEIGIRKALGAEVIDIFILLSKKFIYIIAIAAIVAPPITLYLMNNWLKNFPYRINIEWWFFAYSFLILLIITACVIGFNLYKAANSRVCDILMR